MIATIVAFCTAPRILVSFRQVFALIRVLCGLCRGDHAQGRASYAGGAAQAGFGRRGTRVAIHFGTLLGLGVVALKVI
jgi:hypothetical protein